MNQLATYFDAYSEYHQSWGNKATHSLGIPLIVVSFLGMLSRVSLISGSFYLRLDGGTLLLILALVWYFKVDWKIAGAFSFVLFGFYFLGRCLSLPVNAGIFVIGWILQGIGHAFYEKRSPAFVDNFVHLLVGPLWIFSRVVGYEPRKNS